MADVQHLTSFSPKGLTYKEGTPGLWTEKRLSDAQVTPKSKSNI